MKIIYTTPTPDISLSKSYYESLGFQILEMEKKAYALSSQVIMEIDPKRTARAGVKIYEADVEDLRSKFSRTAKIHEYDQGFLLSDPSNVWIYVEDTKLPEAIKKAGQAELMGNFAGMSLETTDIHRSIEIWSCLNTLMKPLKMRMTGFWL